LSSFRNSEPTGVRINTRTGPPSGAPIAAPVWWAAALYLAAALVAQIEVLHFFSFRGAQLSAVLIVVVWYALRSDMRSAAIFGLVAGVCEDALSAQTGGAWTISTTAVAIFTNYLTRWFFADSPAVVAGVVICATLLRRMIFWVVMALQGYPAGFARLHLHQALWEGVMNAVFALLVILAVRRYEDRPAR
jgi:rod shape-determining protein MreD